MVARIGLLVLAFEGEGGRVSGNRQMETAVFVTLLGALCG